MIKNALAHYSFATASFILLFTFLAVFVGTVIWVFRKDSAKIYKTISALPLNEDH